MTKMNQKSHFEQAMEGVSIMVDEMETAGVTPENISDRLAVRQSIPKCKCDVSTGIDGSITAGTGYLDDYGFFEFPCPHGKAAALEIALKSTAVLEQR
jgi:hypothetical protein